MLVRLLCLCIVSMDVVGVEGMECTGFVHAKCVGCLRVEIRCVFVFLCSTTEETETSTSAGDCFVCLYSTLSGKSSYHGGVVYATFCSNALGS